MLSVFLRDCVSVTPSVCFAFFQSSLGLNFFHVGFSETNSGLEMGGGLFGRFCVEFRGKWCAFFCCAFLRRLPPFFQSSVLLGFFSEGFRERTLHGRSEWGGFFGPENPLFLIARTRPQKVLWLCLLFWSPVFVTVRFSEGFWS